MTRFVFSVLIVLVTSSFSHADIVYRLTDTDDGLRLEVSGSFTEDIHIAGLGSHSSILGEDVVSTGGTGTHASKQSSALITSYDALAIRQLELPDLINPSSGGGDTVQFSFGSMFDDGDGNLTPLALLRMTRDYELGTELSGFSVYEGRSIDADQFIRGRYDFTIEEWRTEVPTWQENITIFVGVPEPASSTLILFGLALIGIQRRRSYSKRV